MKPLHLAISLSLLAAATAASAMDHPAAEAAKRAPAYDYASKMYRHPAGLALLAEAPRALGQHPAVLARQRIIEVNQRPQLAYHPGLLVESPRRVASSQAVEPGLLHPISSVQSRWQRDSPRAPTCMRFKRDTASVVRPDGIGDPKRISRALNECFAVHFDV